MEIEGFNNYLIYPDGRVWTKKRQGTNERFLKPSTDKDGRQHIILARDGKEYTKKIHRLVAEAYIPNPDNLPQVDHIDGNPSNNDVSNLRWCNQSQNQQNTRVSKNNKLRHKNISLTPSNTFLFHKMYQKKLYSKTFKTLEEAIEYRDNFIKKLNDEFVI